MAEIKTTSSLRPAFEPTFMVREAERCGDKNGYKNEGSLIGMDLAITRASAQSLCKQLCGASMFNLLVLPVCFSVKKITLWINHIVELRVAQFPLDPHE